MELVIMRHGRTRGNELRRYVGVTDEPLSEAGAAEAHTVGIHPETGCVYVSPLLRARQTAAICFPNATQVVVDGLREMDFGDFEGRSADDLRDDDDYRRWVDGSCRGRCPNGESREGFVARIAAAVGGLLVREGLAADRVGRRLDGSQSEGSGRRVIIVAHGGTVMAALNAFADRTRYFEWHAGYCGGYRVRPRLLGGAPTDQSACVRWISFRACRGFDDLGFLSM